MEWIAVIAIICKEMKWLLVVYNLRWIFLSSVILEYNSETSSRHGNSLNVIIAAMHWS